MTSNTMSMGGCVTFWSLADRTSHAALETALRACGLQDLVPEKRTRVAALRDAIHAVLGHGDVRSEALKKGGWYVVRALAGVEDVTYRHVLTAKVENKDADLEVTGPSAASYEQALKDELERQTNVLKPPTITAVLTDLVSKLRGNRLRPSGGIYWLPDSALGEWELMSNAVEIAGANRVYKVRHRFDEDSVRAVRDALREEVTNELSVIEAEMEANDCGKRALKNRAARAVSLADKVKFYESVLGELLPDLSLACEKSRAAAAEAALLESAAA